MKITVSTNVGSYDICHPNQKQFVVRVSGLPKESGLTVLTENWDEDDAPSISDDTPLSEVIELISTRLESYWISTKREPHRAVIAWCREHTEELDRIWANTRKEALLAQAGRLHAEANRLDVNFNLSCLPLIESFEKAEA